jgi:chorismate dehydratase
MQKVRISAVSYTNSIPFVYGILNSKIKEEIELTLDYPARCAEKLLNDEVDIGLIPVATIPSMPFSEIVSDYCIGAVGKVRTVILASEVPLKEIQKVFLDYQSKTSVQLVQILAREFWKIDPEWVNATPGFEGRGLGKTTGMVIIGDRAFEAEMRYKYVYDLAEEWKKYCGLPFVFACWVSNKKLDQGFIKRFSDSLKFGIDNRDKSLYLIPEDHKLSDKESLKYLRENISYELDDAKRKGLKKFLSYLT